MKNYWLDRKWHVETMRDCIQRNTRCILGYFKDEYEAYHQFRAILTDNWRGMSVVKPYWYLHKDGIWQKCVFSDGFYRNNEAAVILATYKDIPLRFEGYQEYLNRHIGKGEI